MGGRETKEGGRIINGPEVSAARKVNTKGSIKDGNGKRQGISNGKEN